MADRFRCWEREYFYPLRLGGGSDVGNAAVVNWHGSRGLRVSWGCVCHRYHERHRRGWIRAMHSVQTSAIFSLILGLMVVLAPMAFADFAPQNADIWAVADA